MGNQNSTNTSAPAKVLVLSHQHYRRRSDDYLPEERKGNEKDVERLETLLKQRNIPHLIQNDFTKNQISLALSYFCETEVNESCMAVIVMTHGGEHGELEAYDTEYETRDVYAALQKCKNTKLRLIFFVACRGSDADALVSVQRNRATPDMLHRTEENGQQSVEKDVPYNTDSQSCFGSLIVNEPGFLIVYGSEEERVGLRHPENGTWYIQALCNELNSMQHPEDIMSLLTRVNNKVAAMRGVDDTTGEDVAQSPCIVSSFTSEFIIDCPMTTQSTQQPSVSKGTFFSSVDPTEYSQPMSKEELEVYPQEVHCLMYNSSVYLKEAERVTKTVKKIGFEPIKFNEFSRLLQCIEYDTSPGYKECLFVLIVAELKRGDFGSWDVIVDDRGDSSVKLAWHPCRKNGNFIGKPKIFIFLDPFTEEDMIPTPGMQKDGSLNTTVAENFNFLRVFGFGIDFMEKLCFALENWPHTPEQRRETKRDLCRVIRRAAYDSRKPSKRCTYTESTLGVKLLLIKTAAKNNMIIEETEDELNECYFIVGKERMRIGCDAANHDDCHTILTHMTSSQNEAKRTRIETELTHIEHRAFSIFQAYKRDNTLPETLTCEDACDLVAASQVYRNIPDVLVQHCRDFIVNSCNTVELVCAGLNFAVTARDTEMMDSFLQKVRSETGAILTCENFEAISTETVIRILQQDRLNCTEMQLFQACVRWCENRPNYNSENLRNFMQPFIAHIRFLTMDISEFWSGRISDVLTDQEFGAVMKKLNTKEYDSLPKTISVNNSPRMKHE